jgi:antitoxin MazE
VQRWGNSLAVRVPVAFGRELNLRPECPVDMTIDAGRLVLTPVLVADETPTLAELVARITDTNRHDEQWTDQPKGQEVW